MALAPDRYLYSPIIDRPVLKWPNNARVAFWVAPNVEFYEYTPPVTPGRPSTLRTPAPDLRFYADKDYGNRVAFWRMIDVFDKHNLKVTSSQNQAILEHFPEERDAMVKRGWTFMSHNIYNTRPHGHLNFEEERAYYKDLVDSMKKSTGQQLRGILALSNTPHSPDLLSEAGFTYYTDIFHDDQPFPVKVNTGKKFVSVPYNIDYNDALTLGLGRGWEADDWAQMCRDQFDTLYAEGAESGRVMCIPLHPYLIGQPHRAKYLDEVLGYILGHKGVWNTTADEIAQYYIDNYYDKVLAYVEKQAGAKQPAIRR